MPERVELETMPFDKAFDVDGNETLCHATGFEVCFGADYNCQANWFNEYIDPNGNYHYGR